MIMKTPTFAAIGLLLFPAIPAAADTFTLKDGSTLEGRILREVSGSYVIEVQVTKSIKDERTIPKTDVTKIVKEKPDVAAFKAIAGLYPAPDLLTAEEYGQRIRTVEKFLVEHRGSSKSKEAKDMLAKLKSEANEILAGGIRIHGKIVPPIEYRSNSYEIDAMVQEAKIRALVKDGNYLQSLRAFSNFSRDYRNTSAHAELLPLITQVINSYLNEINEALEGFEKRTRERQIGLDRMPPGTRQATENAIREETAQVEAQFKREKDAKLGWVTTNLYFKPSLDDTVAFGKQELSRIASLKTATPVDAGKAYRDALALIQARGDKAAISTAINAAKTALVPQRYLAILEAAAAVN